MRSDTEPAPLQDRGASSAGFQKAPDRDTDVVFGRLGRKGAGAFGPRHRVREREEKPSMVSFAMAGLRWCSGVLGGLSRRHHSITTSTENRRVSGCGPTLGMT